MRKEPFFAHIPQRTYWMDIGTPARYLQTHQDLLADRVARIHIKDRRGQFDEATIALIDDLSMIGDGCTLKPGAEIINSVLGPNCYIEEKARIENSVIWAHTRVGAGAQIFGAIVGRGCHIGRAAQVGPGTVLGDKASLTDYTLTGGTR
jgi:NDP-sugar pyrophosphorylase family protein